MQWAFNGSDLKTSDLSSLLNKLCWDPKNLIESRDLAWAKMSKTTLLLLYIVIEVYLPFPYMIKNNKSILNI